MVEKNGSYYLWFPIFSVGLGCSDNYWNGILKPVLEKINENKDDNWLQIESIIQEIETKRKE